MRQQNKTSFFKWNTIYLIDALGLLLAFNEHCPSSHTELCNEYEKNKIIQTQARGLFQRGAGAVPAVLYISIFNISIVGTRQSNACVIKQKILFISVIYSFLQDRTRQI